MKIFFGLSAFLFIYAVSLLGCTSTGRRPAGEADRPKPLILGHRGASGYRPEHTQASYELAIQQGADYIEPDLVVSKDGVLVVRHENELSETTDVATKFPKRKTTKTVDGKKQAGWYAEDFTLAELKTLRAKERLPERSHDHDFKYPILTFDEVMDIAQKALRPVGVIPELKHPTYFKKMRKPLEPLLAKALEKRGWNRAESPVLVQSAELSSLKTLHKLSPVKLIWLMDEPKSRPYDFVVSRDRRTFADLAKPAFLGTLSGWLYGIGPWKRLIVPEGKDGKLLPPTSLVHDAHAVGLKVFPYTFRSDATFLAKEYEGDALREYKQFFFLGADGVFSDFPDQALVAVRSMGVAM